MRAGLAQCTEVRALEMAAVKRFGEVPGWTPAVVCNALAGWRVVEISPSVTSVCRGGWVEGSTCVVGYTRVRVRELAVAGPGIPMPVLAHEMVHAIDYAVRGYPGHCGWTARGITSALKDLTGEDDSSADTGCPDAPLDGGE